MALFCTNCGSQIPEGARFCAACGSPAPVQQQTTCSTTTMMSKRRNSLFSNHPISKRLISNLHLILATILNMPPTRFLPRSKKSNAGIIVLITLLALAFWGMGGWALYKYVLKLSAPQENTESSTSYSAARRITPVSQRLSQATTMTSHPVTDSVADDELENQPIDDKPEPNVPNVSNVPSIPKEKAKPSRPNEPFGMTDEEAAQIRRNRNRNVPSIPRTRPSRNNGDPWGMTDEEAAQMNDNYGMPMGMTDEEAAMMRQMQRQQRKARRYRR